MASLPSSSDIPLEDISQIVSFKFESIDEMEDIIHERLDELVNDQTGDEYLAFWGVMPSTFRLLDREDQSIPKLGRLSYHLPSRTLIVRVGAFYLHKVPKNDFTARIYLELDRMGLSMLYAEVGKATVRLKHWRKEADASWSLPQGRPAVRTMIFEMGLLESSDRLEIDAREWLENDNSTTNIVLTCVINRNHQAPKMVVRKYELADDKSSGRAFVRKAVCTGMIELTRSNGTTQIIGKDLVANTTTSTMSDTNLVLSVEKVIGHQPARCSERNVVITGVTLQKICERMWERQGHM